MRFVDSVGGGCGVEWIFCSSEGYFSGESFGVFFLILGGVFFFTSWWVKLWEESL